MGLALANELTKIPLVFHRTSSPLGPLPCFLSSTSQQAIKQGKEIADHLRDADSANCRVARIFQFKLPHFSFYYYLLISSLHSPLTLAGSFFWFLLLSFFPPFSPSCRICRTYAVACRIALLPCYPELVPLTSVMCDRTTKISQGNIIIKNSFAQSLTFTFMHATMHATP